MTRRGWIYPLNLENDSNSTALYECAFACFERFTLCFQRRCLKLFSSLLHELGPADYINYEKKYRQPSALRLDLTARSRRLTLCCWPLISTTFQEFCCQCSLQLSATYFTTHLELVLLYRLASRLDRQLITGVANVYNNVGPIETYYILILSSRSAGLLSQFEIFLTRKPRLQLYREYR